MLLFLHGLGWLASYKTNIRKRCRLFRFMFTRTDLAIQILRFEIMILQSTITITCHRILSVSYAHIEMVVPCLIVFFFVFVVITRNAVVRFGRSLGAKRL